MFVHFQLKVRGSSRVDKSALLGRTWIVKEGNEGRRRVFCYFNRGVMQQCQNRKESYAYNTQQQIQPKVKVFVLFKNQKMIEKLVSVECSDIP